MKGQGLGRKQSTECTEESWNILHTSLITCRDIVIHFHPRNKIVAATNLEMIVRQTFVMQWLMAQDMGLYRRRIEVILRYDECLGCGGVCVEKQWDRSTVESELFYFQVTGNQSMFIVNLFSDQSSCMKQRLVSGVGRAHSMKCVYQCTCKLQQISLGWRRSTLCIISSHILLYVLCKEMLQLFTNYTVLCA